MTKRERKYLNRRKLENKKLYKNLGIFIPKGFIDLSTVESVTTTEYLSIEQVKEKYGINLEIPPAIDNEK